MPTYRSRRGDLQVHGLKDEVGGGGELYDLSTHQTQLLVVVQHSVHVLDPDGIHRPIEDEPLAVGRGGVGEGLVADGEDAVGPLVRDGVKAAVELAHSDGLGVEHNDLHLVLLQQTLCRA